MMKFTLCSLTLITLTAASAQASSLYCELDDHDGTSILIKNASTGEPVGNPIQLIKPELGSKALQSCEKAIAPFACDAVPQQPMTAEWDCQNRGRCYTTTSYQLVDLSIECSSASGVTVMKQMATEEACLNAIHERGEAALVAMGLTAAESPEEIDVRIQMYKNPSDKTQNRQ